jgi:hypothetical protein
MYSPLCKCGRSNARVTVIERGLKGCMAFSADCFRCQLLAAFSKIARARGFF